jgi:hypothetical protein
MVKAPSISADKLFERKKWKSELDIRKREVGVQELEAAIKQKEAEIKDREQRLKNRELRLKILELRRSRLTNPVFLAIIGATVTAGGTAIGAWFTARSQMELEEKRQLAQQQIERFKADSTLILEVVKTSNATVARDNLKFLVTTEQISDEQRRNRIEKYLAGPGPTPTLPAPTTGLHVAQGLSLACSIPQDIDLLMLAAEVEKNLRISKTVSNVQTASKADLVTLIVELTVNDGGAACPGVGPRSGRVVIVIRKVTGKITIDFDVAIPRLLWVAFSPNITRDVIADLTKMLESKMGVGKVVCTQIVA